MNGEPEITKLPRPTSFILIMLYLDDRQPHVSIGNSLETTVCLSTKH